MRSLVLIAIAGAALFVSACGGGGGEPTASPSESPTSTPTLTVSPSPSPAPTATPEVSAEEACPSAVVIEKSAGGEAAYLYTGWEEGGVICWTDISGEASYRVQGAVEYWVPPPPQRCDETPAPRQALVDLVTSPAPEPEFSQDLPANTTRFELPKHPDNRVRIKDYSIYIEAVDSNGDVIASGGTGVTLDAFCE